MKMIVSKTLAKSYLVAFIGFLEGVTAELPEDLKGLTLEAISGSKEALSLLEAQAQFKMETKSSVMSFDGENFIFEVKQEKGSVVAGEKQRDVVQVKDSRAKATGGWRYATFDPSGKRRAVDATGCAACHAQAASTDMVFTRLAP